MYKLWQGVQGENLSMETRKLGMSETEKVPVPLLQLPGVPNHPFAKPPKKSAPLGTSILQSEILTEINYPKATPFRLKF